MYQVKIYNENTADTGEFETFDEAMFYVNLWVKSEGTPMSINISFRTNNQKE